MADKKISKYSPLHGMSTEETEALEVASLLEGKKSTEAITKLLNNINAGNQFLYPLWLNPTQAELNLAIGRMACHLAVEKKMEAVQIIPVINGIMGSWYLKNLKDRMDNLTIPAGREESTSPALAMADAL